MSRVSFLLLMSGLAALVGCAGGSVRTDASLSRYFGDYDGAIVLRNMRTHEEVRYGGRRCTERVSPCSTFKLPHTVAAVDSGVADEDTVFTWDGVQRGATWDQDQTLASAFRRSAAWCYQQVARRMGRQREQHYLQLFGYGNRDDSGPLDRFWIMSSLQISPAEQVDFLERLYCRRLPVSAHAQDVARRVAVMESGPDFEVSGKTGSGVRPGDEALTVINNWFVGHVLIRDGEWVFATNIQGPVRNRLEAQRITLEILQDRVGLRRSVTFHPEALP